VQYDDGPQWPLALHACEQHSAPPTHGLPSVLHVVLSGVHVPPAPHAPPQHSPLVVHAALSATHWVPEHTLLTQLTEQQSVFEEHPVFAAPHIATLTAHVAVVGSQIPEQQSVSPTHATPNVAQFATVASLPLPLPLPLLLPSTFASCLPPHANSSITRLISRPKLRSVMAPGYREDNVG